MSVGFAIGIDVGGAKKGFHAAITELETNAVVGLIHALTPEDLCYQWMSRGFEPTVVAIDCPRLARLSGTSTRLAERQLHRLGIRVQWTRRTHEPPEWMLNGEKLWAYLSTRYPGVTLIECFPSVAARALSASNVSLQMRLFAEHSLRRDWKDLVDSCIAANVAIRYLQGTATSYGFDAKTGETDELGLIYC